ncbi:MAG: hypothetical protein JOY62_09525 [Acidobacteriaceae bacterium]|nr:hypothetical protein [Acidobacteriaceae bacterium]MBV9780200.1 hypothetical protein [Acidobacteriaceae bacterium]
MKSPLLSSGVALAALVLATASIAHAQTYSVLYNFGAHTGDPNVPVYTGLLAQGRDGNLYSTTPYGGTLCSFCGTVFKVTPSGTLTVIDSFNDTAGAAYNPHSGLTLGTDGDFYGTTSAGGTKSWGTVFKVTPSGALTTLYSFDTTCTSPCIDGAFPTAPPVEGRDGDYYGTTPHSGDGTNSGVVYRITPAGAYTILHRFVYTAAGFNPQAPLILGADGNFYGTTTLGGKVPSNCGASNTEACGTVFKMTPSGTVTFLHEFDKTDGAAPVAPVVQASDGNFYGTTSEGGDANGDGVIFKLTPSGQLTVLHSFNGTTDGKRPTAGLVEATDGNFYGATTLGGSKNYGTLYKITSAGAFSVIYNFDQTTGADPQVTLFQHTNGDLYGEAYNGGKFGQGTFYTLDTELLPFVSLVPTWGTVGTSIGILGQGFTSATAVSFNGASAKFTVHSDTYLTATVPSGATAGAVSVTTGIGILKSNQAFVVVPSITGFTPTSGDAGDTVVITGGGFTKASAVTFGGVKATAFTVNSSSKITATVPTGVKTGKITVTTPAGTATSSGTFTVVP